MVASQEQHKTVGIVIKWGAGREEVDGQWGVRRQGNSPPTGWGGRYPQVPRFPCGSLVQAPLAYDIISISDVS